MLVHRARPETEQLKARATKSPVGFSFTVLASDVHVGEEWLDLKRSDMMCFLFVFEKRKNLFFKFYFPLKAVRIRFAPNRCRHAATASHFKKQDALFKKTLASTRRVRTWFPRARSINALIYK